MLLRDFLRNRFRDGVEMFFTWENAKLSAEKEEVCICSTTNGQWDTEQLNSETACLKVIASLEFRAISHSWRQARLLLLFPSFLLKDGKSSGNIGIHPMTFLRSPSSYSHKCQFNGSIAVARYGLMVFTLCACVQVGVCGLEGFECYPQLPFLLV